jgi:linoleoyl-CoA desaturase
MQDGAAPAPITLPRAGRPQFPAHSPLRGELCRRVDAYFEGRALDSKGGAPMLRKTATIVLWAVASYALLVFVATTWWSAALLCVSLGLALAGIGFAVMHDGGHGSYSSHGWLNRLSAAALDAVGGSSYFWHHKHNLIHHSYTNVDGVDDDIDAAPFLRMADSQPLYWFHRFQHWYMVPLYGLFFATKWYFVDDVRSWIKGTIGQQSVPRPRGWDAVQLVAGKLFFVTWALVVPLLLHPPLVVLAAYLGINAVLGITLALVFQLAHAVDGATFVSTPAAKERLERPFVEHQIATTANFAPANPVVTWYVAGLNFQIEHHLFPRVSHIHYPAIARIVRELCEESGVEYLSHATVWSALSSHVRFMKRIGKGEPMAPGVARPPALLAAA